MIPPVSRRGVLAAGGAGAVGLAAAGAANAQPPPPAPVDRGMVQGGAVSFPPIHAQTDPPVSPSDKPDPPSRRVGFAIVGLGRLALEQVLPAFGEAKHCRPVALVSGSPEKLAAVGDQYGIRPEARLGYDAMERLRDLPEVEVVYVITPNALHRRDVLAAARAGKHVLTEKPMAVNSAECRDMIAACRSAGRKLMVAYRMQYQPHCRELIRAARAGELGQLRFIDAVNTQAESDPSQWRLKRALAGGGSLPDIGLYCLNTTRTILGEEPVEIEATIRTDSTDPRFREVEDTVSFTMRFPSGVVASCGTSYSAHQFRRLSVVGSTGWGEMQRAFDYDGQTLAFGRREGEREVEIRPRIESANQFAAEMDHFAQCVRENRTPRTPGEEGLQDHLLMEAIYRAAQTRRAVSLPPAPVRDATRGPEPASQS